jgi:hypothetical protein
MNRTWILLIVLSSFLFAGCEKKGDSTETANVKIMAVCPTCNQKMPEDTYCAGCNAIATTETKPVHCDECDVDFKPGTYCSRCNRFMLNAKVHCGNCRSKVVKGHYCTTEKLFKGLPDVAYCQEHAKPYGKNSSCPNCPKQVVGSNL